MVPEGAAVGEADAVAEEVAVAAEAAAVRAHGAEAAAAADADLNNLPQLSPVIEDILSGPVRWSCQGVYSFICSAWGYRRCSVTQGGGRIIREIRADHHSIDE